MDGRQYTRRQALLAEMHSALDAQWVQAPPKFCSRVERIVRELEELAREVDETSVDRLERARNWRLLGNALVVLALGGQSRRMEEARAAIERSEELLAEIEIPSEKMKLAYSQGYRLQQQGRMDATGSPCLEAACAKYNEALGIARGESREAAMQTERALDAVRREIELLNQYENIMAEIASCRRRTAACRNGKPAGKSVGRRDAEILGRFLQLYERMQEAQNSLREYEDQAGRTLLWL